MIDMPSAIKALGVDEFVCDSVGTKEMFDTTYKSLSENNPAITWDQVNKKMTELQAEYDNDYSRKRQAEYPSIQECVHAILDDDLTALQEKRQAVKTKYPKS
tara:strand:- start:109 stop:414 length:306 start_codon:yes stop_codon:yes gene_type:complete